MKTKRRHDLQTNQLADWIGHQIEAIKPYRQYLVGGVVAILVLVLVLLYQLSGSREQKAAAWRAYYTAMSERRPEQLDAIAQAYPKSEASLLAMQAAADIYLEEGSRLVYTDRETANESLKKAAQKFSEVIQRAGGNRFLETRARLGLAQTYESLNELGSAKESYEKLTSPDSDEVIGQLAMHSIKRLDDSSTLDVFRRLAGDIIDPAMEYPDLPERADFSFPGDATALAEWTANEAMQAEEDDPDEGDTTDQPDEETDAPAEDAESIEPNADQQSTDQEKADQQQDQEQQADEPAPREPAAEPAEPEPEGKSDQDERESTSDAPAEPESKTSAGEQSAEESP